MSFSLESTVMQECAFGVIEATMSELMLGGMRADILVPEELKSSSHLMPRLIELKRFSIEQRNAFFERIQDATRRSEHPSGAIFIVTDTSADELSRHWNRLQLVRYQKRKFWLRLHDPRVLHQLLRILNQMQRQRLFGRARAFYYQVGEQWITARRNPDEQNEERGPSVGIEGWDWPRIERIGIVNRALHHAGIKDADALTRQGVLAEQLIERAITRYGLDEQADLVEFTLRGLQTNPAFDEHPQVNCLIKAEIDSSDITSLSDRFSIIEEQVWKTLRQSANSSMGARHEFHQV